MARERTIPGTHYIRNPETGEIDIYDNPPESLAPFIIPPEQLPGVPEAPRPAAAPGTQPPDWISALDAFRQGIQPLAEQPSLDYDAILADFDARPPETPATPRSSESLADLIPRAEPAAPLPPSSPTTPSLAGSLPAPVPNPRSQVPQLATPTTPALIPLADYLQQRLLEVGGPR